MSISLKQKIEFIKDFCLKYPAGSIQSKYWLMCHFYELNRSAFSEEFDEAFEQEILYIYKECKELESQDWPETRTPALHTRATLCKYGIPDQSPTHFVRVNDDSPEGFTDYDLTHHDLDVLILDSTAEFIKTSRGNYLDYSKEVTGR